MFANNGFPPFPSNPDPDFSSGTTTLLKTSVSEQASTPRTSPPTVSQKAKPNIPQKKMHVDELYRLKRDLEEVTRDRDQAIEMKNMMAEDLLTAQEVLEKDDALKSAMKDMWMWKDKAEKAAAAAARSESSPSSQDMQQHFQIQLQQKDDELRSQLAKEKDLRLAAESELNNTRAQHELRVKEMEQHTNTQLEAERRRTQTTETMLNEQMNRMDIDSTSQQRHEQVIAKYEADLRDQRQRSNQFRKTCERLTTQIKQANEAKRDLERSERGLRQGDEDMKSQIAVLRAQLRDYRMPGSFSDGVTHQFS